MALFKKDDPPQAPLPEGYAWRRGSLQLVERFGAFPGDQAAILAPPTHDPAPDFAKRLPRIRWLKIHTGPFGSDGDPPADVETVDCKLLKPPLEPESLDAIVVVFAVPLLDGREHTKFVEAWSQTLAPLGKWLSLLSLKDSRDPRLQEAEQTLKDHGFERVRTNRLPGGGGKSTLAVMSARMG